MLGIVIKMHYIYKYAGIGARATPERTLAFMADIATVLDSKGYTLRSGGAFGADSAFARGATHKEIFTAKDATAAARQHASRFHPAWGSLSEYVKNLMARNSMVILGRHLNDPVQFVVCWTPDGRTVGGTGQSLRIAEAMQIPVLNMALYPEAFIAGTINGL